MAMITLRAYNNEIESLIEANRNEEAIYHCMVILQKHPKSVDTYRNLGKALLESKRYNEAGEVFSKVLSVFPDDFISHIGLSIIKEDERDLDAAIWHMEQAFESQPSNLALQEELRRLFGRRDGVPPTKIRLTRGALVKMYARGDLHQQAIAEIKGILKDEPTRVDYQVLLAKMYQISGSYPDAIETASKVLDKYPFCFEPNKILNELLPITGHSESARVYHERLIALDPYYEFVDSQALGIIDVPAEKVMIEEKAYSSASEQESTLPDWSKQIGLNWQEKETVISPEESDLIDQVDAFEGKAFEPVDNSTVSPFIGGLMPEIGNDTESHAEKQPEPLPDWITKAGWTRPSDPDDSTPPANEPVESPEPFRALENENQDQAVPSDELPEWLRSLSPDNKLDPLESESPQSPIPPFPDFGLSDIQENIPTPDDLKDALNSWESSTEKPDETLRPAEENVESSPSEWISQFSDSNADSSGEESDTNLPDWLKNFAQDETGNAPEDGASSDWLSSLIDEEQGKSFQKEEDNISVPEETEVLAEENKEVESFSLEDRFTEIGLTSEPRVMDSEVTQQTPDLEKIDDAIPSMVESPSEVTPPPLPIVEGPETQESDMILPSKELEVKPEVPSWVKNLLSTAPVLTPNEPEPANQSIKEEERLEPLLSDLPDASEQTGAISEETNEELLSWLKDVNPSDEKFVDQTIQTLQPVSESAETNLSEELAAETEIPDFENRLNDLLEQPIDENVSLAEIESVSSIETAESLDEFEVIEPAVDVKSTEPAEINEQFTEVEELKTTTGEISDHELPMDLGGLSATIPPLDELEPRNIVEDFSDEIPETIPEETITEEAPAFEAVLPEINFGEKLTELVEEGDFSSFTSLIDEKIASGESPEFLIETVKDLASKNEKSFGIWQELGDLYLKQNKLDDALSAFLKAEKNL